MRNQKTSRGIVIAIILILIYVWGFPMCAYGQDITDDTNDKIIQEKADFQNSKPKVKVKRNHKINIRVSWGKIKNADKYIVYRKTKNGKYKRIKTTTKRSYTDKKKFKSKYVYKVRAYYKKYGVYSRYSNGTAKKSNVRKKFRVKAYAYHESGGVCANGQPCKVGRIATDPRVIPTGTWLYVNGYGLCKACDTGGDIKGRIVDLYMNSEGACNRWGVRYPQVYILK